MKKPKRAPSPIATSTRAERAAWHPHDFGPVSDYPQIGIDIAAKDGPDGWPVPQWETRLQAYGPHGFRHETKCPHCAKWLSYRVCASCSSMIRLMGAFEQDCSCRMDSLYIYGRCEDHKMYEDPLNVPGG
jgi:hypothetical protein